MRPRERFVWGGGEGLGDAELVALILGTGVRGRTAEALGAELLERFGGLDGLERREVAELAAVRGIGPARALRLSAAFALGRRARVDPAPVLAVDGPEAAHRLLAPRLRGLRAEELHGLFLDRRRRPLSLRTLTRGSERYTIVEPRLVFRVAVAVGADAVILAHNHPSGDPTPSVQDLEVTDRVARAGRVLGLPLLDHLVIGGSGFRSLAREGALPEWVEAAPDVVADAASGPRAPPRRSAARR